MRDPFAWPEDRRITDLRRQLADALAALTGYFIAEDAAGDEWLWRANGDTPHPVVARRDVDDPDVWAVLVRSAGVAS